MWMAELDAVLQRHLVQLNEETDGMGVVFGVEWLFVHGTSFIFPGSSQSDIL